MLCGVCSGYRQDPILRYISQEKKKSPAFTIVFFGGRFVFDRWLLVVSLGLNHAFYVIDDDISVNIFYRFDGQAQVVVAINKWRV